MIECAFIVQVTIGHFSYFLSESESHIFSTTCATMDWASQRLALGRLRPADWYRLLQEATTIHCTLCIFPAGYYFIMTVGEYKFSGF